MTAAHRSCPQARSRRNIGPPRRCPLKEPSRRIDRLFGAGTVIAAIVTGLGGGLWWQHVVLLPKNGTETPGSNSGCRRSHTRDHRPAGTGAVSRSDAGGGNQSVVGAGGSAQPEQGQQTQAYDSSPPPQPRGARHDGVAICSVHPAPSSHRPHNPSQLSRLRIARNCRQGARCRHERAVVEKRRYDRRQQWAEKRRYQRQDQELRDVEQKSGRNRAVVGPRGTTGQTRNAQDQVFEAE